MPPLLHFDALEDKMQTTSIRHDTKAWRVQVGVSFFAAAFLCAVGLAWLPAAIAFVSVTTRSHFS